MAKTGTIICKGCLSSSSIWMTGKAFSNKGLKGPSRFLFFGQSAIQLGFYKSSSNLISRHSSTYATKMKAWQIHQYGGVDELTLTHSAKAAAIKSPHDIRVKVHASSVNPIDVRMLDGYGRKLINILRRKNGTLKAGTEFPLILGRDFAGEVVETGRKVRKFKVGDQVWGALAAERPGTHAEYTVVSQDEISMKPNNLDYVEAASLPYVAMTTWAALCTVGQLTENQALGKKLLVLGASGGIGNFVVQLGKAWGMEVVGTCPEDAITQVEANGAIAAFDYMDANLWQNLSSMGSYDLILDTVGGDTTMKATELLTPCPLPSANQIIKNPLELASMLTQWQSKLVTLNFPLLRNSDDNGIVPGLARSVFDAGKHTLQGLKSGSQVRWAVFMPNGKAMNRVRKMVESGQIKPKVEEVFPFEEVPSAYTKVINGHLKGKIVVKTD